MPFDAAILGYVEDALSECFKYHNALDAFLLRSGVARTTLDSARKRADDKASAAIHREYSRAPKRFVVQEILADLSAAGEGGDRAVAAIVTALIGGNFSDATLAAKDAIDGLKG
ncbi:hypothetical protein OF829_04865 [Sphingomonas sp. LB-2]|uniref:hypothetical protein n=1 Tax=Sphingomonas caeni TaxID=2984949 RepID=UPI00223109C6|nr:hypothetical protein [Sphingomonas caeni]MCW3846560.1 hypothetical protein [Sphingomonas caeni]